MKKYILDNGIELIIEQRESEITSFCIGFNAGAIEEEGFNEGTAHAVEHMVFKGTLSRTERQINDEIDEYFGFSNAMTNYPYCIYYGTVINEDFISGFSLYSDILLNPTFEKTGFYEEMKIIKEELRDWREDKNQRCEDLLLHNAFPTRRIRELIIGSEESVDKITLEEIWMFYKKYYSPNNCVISIVSSIDSEYLYSKVNNIFGLWKRESTVRNTDIYEKNNPSTFINEDNIEGAKIQFCYTIDNLSKRELICLQYFNIIFGEGTSSILYNEVRTEKGLAYEVGSIIKKERGIKLLIIHMSTSKENTDKAVEAVFNSISKMVEYNWCIDNRISRIRKRLRLKESLTVERSIELCKKIATFQLMYETYGHSLKELDDYDITGEEIANVVKKVLKEPTIQILV